MEDIQKNIMVDIPHHIAYDLFIDELDEWWPQDYTWSQKKLVSIKINGYLDGLCTETGPGGFRCDWGRVIEIDRGKFIRFKWQIGPNREPVPDETKSSQVSIYFQNSGINRTLILLRHSEFENHGEGWKEYRAAMNSAEGWDFILDAFLDFFEATKSYKTLAK